MTVPNERYNSIEYVRKFLYSLIDPKQTPRVPKNIRKEAGARLRHFPSPLVMELTRKKAPEIWGDEAPKSEERS